MAVPLRPYPPPSSLMTVEIFPQIKEKTSQGQKPFFGGQPQNFFFLIIFQYAYCKIQKGLKRTILNKK